MNMEPIVMLLVEDDEDDVRLALTAMREDKIANRVFRAVDGFEAIDFLLRRGEWEDLTSGEACTGEQIPRPHLILLDLKMPRMDGFEFLKARDERPDLQTFLRIPVVAFTSSDADEDVQEAYDAGAASYIVKPTDLLAFRQVVRHLHEYWIAIVRYPRPPLDAPRR